MENNKIICSNCEKELKATDKFCTSCGTKNEAFSQEVFKETADADIAVKAVVNEVKKPKSKKKLFIGLAVAAAVLLVFSLAAPSLYAAIFPSQYVKSVIGNTFKSFEKDNKKFGEVPTLSSLFGDSGQNSEKELYLKIDSVNSNQSLTDLSSLADYGARLKMQSNKDNTVANFNLVLLEDKNEIVGGTVYYDKDKIALEMPKLFKDILGIKIEKDNSSESGMNNGNYQSFDEFNNMIESASELLESSNDIKGIYTELALEYTDKFTDLVVFEKNKSYKGVYTATISGDDLVSLVKDFLIELYDNEQFKEYLASSMYLSEGSYYDKDYYIDMVENTVLSLPDEIDYMLEDVEIGDLIINAEIEKNTMKSLDVSIDLASYGESFKIKYIMNYIDEKDKHGIDFDLKLGSFGNYESLNGSVRYIKEGKNLKRDISLNSDLSNFDADMSFNVSETVKDNKQYEYLLTAKINDGYEDVKVEFETLGTYKNKNRIDYENINLFLSVNGETVNLKLSGYVSNTKIKSVNTVDSEKITYLNELDEQDFENLYEEIMMNIYMIIRNFGGLI